MLAAAHSRLCSRDLPQAGVFVIGIVHIRNCWCGVSSACFLCQLETVIFHYINRRYQQVVKADDKKVWC